MKIIGIGKNYVNEASELPTEAVVPVIFTKPDSSLLENNEDLQLPAVSNDVWYEIEIAFRIGKKGKDIKAEDALQHVDALALANDLTAKDVLAKSRDPKKGPWALAKGFDGATPISAFKPIDAFADVKNINFSLTVDGEERQKGNTSLMITPLDQLIAYVSSFMTLNPGDILLTGTPAKGAAQIQSGELMVGYLEGEKMLETQVL